MIIKLASWYSLTFRGGYRKDQRHRLTELDQIVSGCNESENYHDSLDQDLFMREWVGGRWRGGELKKNQSSDIGCDSKGLHLVNRYKRWLTKLRSLRRRIPGLRQRVSLLDRKKYGQMKVGRSISDKGRVRQIYI